MNPLLVFLILVSIGVCLVLTLGILLGLFEYGLRFDLFIVFLILSAICVYLLIFLKRILSAKGSLLEFPGSERVDEFVRIKITGIFMLGTFLVLGFLAILLSQIESMRNWLGVISFIMGLALLLSGISQFRSQEASRPQVLGSVAANQLELLERYLSSHKRATKYTVLADAVVGAFCVLFFFSLGGARLFSVWDLVGFLFLLSSHCSWSFMHGISVERRIDSLKRQAV